MAFYGYQQLAEIKHPFDLDMIDDLNVLDHLITKLKNSNFSANEMNIAGSSAKL